MKCCARNAARPISWGNKKPMKVRLGEQAAVKRGDPKNEIAVHCP